MVSNRQSTTSQEDMVEIDVTELERFHLENSYNVTVTITTDLGNMSSSTIFGKSNYSKINYDLMCIFYYLDTCTPFGGGKK